jgi:hypothetical protein
MKIISKEKLGSKKYGHTQYLFDTGYKYWVFADCVTKAFTPTGRYPSQVIKQKMERIISKYEDRRIQWTDHV